MDKIIVNGGNSLQGSVAVSGSKNAVLPVLAATLLTSGKNRITNVPRVRDVTTMVRLVRELGGKIDHFEADAIVLDSSAIDNPEAPYDLVSTMRASCMVLGPLLARLGQARVSLPGGCAIGARPIDLHLKALSAMGAEIVLEGGYIRGTAKKLRGIRHYFDTVSVTGTANVMMAAVLADGETLLENVAREPEVVFLADVLNRSGAKIEGAGNDTIIIQGVASLKPIECRIPPDRIEAGTYMIAAAMTRGNVEIRDCIPSQLETLVLKLLETGTQIEVGSSSIKVRGQESWAAANITTQPYPGFPTDFQAQFMAMMTLAEGQSIMMETVFENRFMHAAELKRMGADITLRGNTAIIKGVKYLSGAPVMATDLRASASLVLAALAARGESTVSRIYHIDRGYENMAEKLARLGATVHRRS